MVRNRKLKKKRKIKATLTYLSPGDPLLKRMVISTMEWLTGRRKLQKLYSEVKREAPLSYRVWEAVLEKLEVGIIYDEDQLQKAPVEGPVIFMANHPFGVVDGLILGYLISRIRSQFKVLVNEVLCREEMLTPYLLPIDFRETKAALQTNIDTRRAALQHLKADEAIGIFPAGGVATSPNFLGAAQDLEWKRFVIKLISQTKATVIPIYVHGQNSRLFQVVSQFSQNLRLSLLLNEVRNKMGTDVTVTIGDPIPYSAIADIKDRQQLLDYLRAKTYELSHS